MIRRIFVPFTYQGRVIDDKLRTEALDHSIARLVETYGFCRKWNFECSMPAKDARPGESRFETVTASVLEVTGVAEDTFLDIAGALKTALQAPIYIEIADKRVGKFI